MVIFLIECPVWAIWSFNGLREYSLLFALSYGLFRLRLLRLWSIVMNNHRLELYHTLIIKVHASAMDNEKTDRTFCKNLRWHHVVFFFKENDWNLRKKHYLNCIVVRRVFSATNFYLLGDYSLGWTAKNRGFKSQHAWQDIYKAPSLQTGLKRRVFA